MKPMLIACASLLYAISAHADTLADLKHSLAALPGKQPLHALIDVTRSRHSHGRILNDDFEGAASIDVVTDQTATRAIFLRSMLDRSAVNRPLAMTLNEINGPAIERALDFAPVMQRLIARGRVVEDRATTYENRPSRMLRLELPPGAAEGDDATEPNTTADTLTIWATSGLPLGATRVRKGTAGMLFVHVDTVRTQTWRFEALRDRLVAARFEDRAVVTGPIQRGDAATVWTVKELAP